MLVWPGYHMLEKLNFLNNQAMILYNVTVNIEPDVHDDWLSWMKEKHIPDIMNTGLFRGHYMFRIISNPQEEGLTYCIQYFLDSVRDYEKYQEKYAPDLQQEFEERYRDKFVAARTIMKEV